MLAHTFLVHTFRGFVLISFRRFFASFHRSALLLCLVFAVTGGQTFADAPAPFQSFALLLCIRRQAIAVARVERPSAAKFGVSFGLRADNGFSLLFRFVSPALDTFELLLTCLKR